MTILDRLWINKSGHRLKFTATCHVTIHRFGPTIAILLHLFYRAPHSLLSHLLKHPLLKVDCVNYYFRSSSISLHSFSPFFFFCRLFFIILTTPIHLAEIRHFESDRLMFYVFHGRQRSEIYIRASFLCLWSATRPNFLKWSI